MSGPDCTDPDCHANAFAAAHAWSEREPNVVSEPIANLLSLAITSGDLHSHRTPDGYFDGHPDACPYCRTDTHADDDPTADTAY